MSRSAEVRRRAAEAWLVASLVGAVFGAIEIVIGQSLDWWQIEDVAGTLNVALALLLVAASTRLLHYGAASPSASPGSLALLFALAALAAWVARLLMALDVLFVGFGARPTAQALGSLFMGGAFILAAVALSRASAAGPRAPATVAMSWALALLVIGIGLTLALAIFGAVGRDFLGGVWGVVIRAPIIGGLVALGTACAAARRAAMREIDLTDVF